MRGVRVLLGMAIILLIVASSSIVFAKTISEYLQDVDAFYTVVLGKEGKGGDTFAAADIITGLSRSLPNKVILEAAIEGEVPQKTNKILVGHPCDNSWIQMSCEQWPYEPGESIIQVQDNDLIVAGSTVDDTRRAAKVIANFKNFPQLKENWFVVVKGTTLNVDDLIVQKAKTETQFICGDRICEPGEKIVCPGDCQQISCNDICGRKKLGEASCVDTPLALDKDPCPGKVTIGSGYCATGKTCCCAEFEETKTLIPEEKPSTPEIVEIVESPQKKPNIIAAIFEALMRFFQKLFS